jgi:hypothetical protein
MVLGAAGIIGAVAGLINGVSTWEGPALIGAGLLAVGYWAYATGESA